MEVIEKLRKNNKDYVIVADFLVPLVNYLEDKKDPIHKAIYKRLKELKNKYLSRKAGIQQIIESLRKEVDYLTSYEREIKTLKPEDRLLKQLEFYLLYKGIKVSPTKELGKCIREFLAKQPTEEVKSRLKEELILSVEEGDEKLERILDSLIEDVLIPLKREMENAEN